MSVLTEAATRDGGTPTGGRPRRRDQSRTAYVFLSPWILGALGLTLGPMLFSLYLSFTSYDMFSAPSWVGLDNYVRLFTDDTEFRDSAWVTIKYVLMAAPLKLVIALAVAMLLNNQRRGRSFYRSAFYLPSLVGASVSIAIVWKVLFSTDGPVEQVLSVFGIHTGGWVGQPQYSLLVLVLLAAWQFGAPMVIFLAGLLQIPRDLYESAEIDGAGPWQRFVSITVPMLSPVIFFNLVLEVINAFQAFNGAFIVSQGTGAPAGSTLLYTLSLYQIGFNDFRMGYAAAMAWILVAGVGIVTALIFRSSRGWVFYAGESS